MGAIAELEALEPGAQVGKYELIRRLAVGGMAEVHLARAVGIEGFEKQVVLKRILPQYADQRGFVRMFLDEARLAATLHHPNIVQVFDIGEYAGNYYFAMEYLRGRDVREILARAQRKRVKLPLGIAISIGIGVCAGLHYAHEKADSSGTPLGIVHRDVSPSNVIVTRDGSSKVLDFGVAKAASHQTQTRAGTLKGKIAYMSPEQCRGEALDRMSDVFAIGILLFEMTTGTRLFKGGSELEILNKIASEDAPSPALRRPDYPGELERIVRRALARDKIARYRTAQDLQRDLERFARDERLSTSPLDVTDLLMELFPEDFTARPAPAPRGKRKASKHVADEPSVLIVDCFAKDGDDEGDEDQPGPPLLPRGTGQQEALETAMLCGPSSAARSGTRALDGSGAERGLEDGAASAPAAARADSAADSMSALLAESQKSLAELARAQRRARAMTGIGAALIGAAVAAFVFGGGQLPWLRGAAAPSLAAPSPVVPAAKPAVQLDAEVAPTAEAERGLRPDAQNGALTGTEHEAPIDAAEITMKPAIISDAIEAEEAADSEAPANDETVAAREVGREAAARDVVAYEDTAGDDEASADAEAAEAQGAAGASTAERRRQRRRDRRDRRPARRSKGADKPSSDPGWNPDSALLPGM